MSTQRSTIAPLSPVSSWSIALILRWRWLMVAITGTTISWPQLRRCASPKRWDPRISCSCSTPRARPPSPRASCTPPAATSPRSPSATSTSSTSNPSPMSTGARPISVGSPATATSSTARWPTAPPRCSTKALRTHRARIGCGTSSSAMASRSSTRLPPPSVRS